MKNFTTRKPTKPGYYWYKKELNDNPEIVEIQQGKIWIIGTKDSDNLEFTDGFWLGPIQPETES